MLRVAEALAVNAVALYGLTRDEWSLATLFVVYWGENLMNTAFVDGRILLHRVLTRKRGHWKGPNTGTVTIRINGKEIRHAPDATTTLLASFVATNVIFSLAHGVFVVAFVFGVLHLGPSEPSVRRGLLAMLTAQAIGFALDAVTIRTRSFAWIRRRADAALGRMFIKLLYDLAAAAPWKQELPEKAPAFVRALGRMVKKPGVEDVWKKEVDAQRRKQIEDEEPMH